MPHCQKCKKLRLVEKVKFASFYLGGFPSNFCYFLWTELEGGWGAYHEILRENSLLSDLRKIEPWLTSPPEMAVLQSAT
jgi:hypothetical protein